MLVRDGDRVVWMGDSITAQGADVGGWCRLVCDGLRAKGVDVTWFAAGVPNNTASQVAARLAAEGLVYEPQWVGILAGTNNVVAYHPSPNIATYQGNITSMISAAEAAGARVLLMTLPRFDPPQDPDWNATAGALNDVLRSYAASRPTVLLADVGLACLAQRERLTDEYGIHPDAAGHALIAATVLAAWGIEG